MKKILILFLAWFIPFLFVKAEVNCPAGLVPASEDFKAAFKRHNPGAEVPQCMDKKTGDFFQGVESAKQYLLMLYKRASGRNCCHDPIKAINGLNPRFAVCGANFLKAFEQTYNIPVALRYAYRSTAEQAKICPVAIPGKCAPAGRSNHQRGLAMDINLPNRNYALLHAFARKNPGFGVTFPIPKSDPVHMQPTNKQDPKCVDGSFSPERPSADEIADASKFIDSPDLVSDNLETYPEPESDFQENSNFQENLSQGASYSQYPYATIPSDMDGLPISQQELEAQIKNALQQTYNQQGAFSSTSEDFETSNSDWYNADNANEFTQTTDEIEQQPNSKDPDDKPSSTPTNTLPVPSRVKKTLLRAYMAGDLPKNQNTTRLTYALLNGTVDEQKKAAQALKNIYMQNLGAYNLNTLQLQHSNNPTDNVNNTLNSNAKTFSKTPWELIFSIRKNAETKGVLNEINSLFNNQQEVQSISIWHVLWSRIKSWFASNF